jgi:hypothetical protein
LNWPAHQLHGVARQKERHGIAFVDGRITPPQAGLAIESACSRDKSMP